MVDRLHSFAHFDSGLAVDLAGYHCAILRSPACFNAALPAVDNIELLGQLYRDTVAAAKGRTDRTSTVSRFSGGRPRWLRRLALPWRLLCRSKCTLQAPRICYSC